MRLQLITDNRPVPSPGMNTMVTILCNNDSSRNLSVPGSAVLQKTAKPAYSYTTHPTAKYTAAK